MGRNRSLCIPVKVDVAQRAHNCKANHRHRIQRGEKRLNVHKAGKWYHRYCLDCARKMIRRNIDGLEALDSELRREETEGNSDD